MTIEETQARMEHRGIKEKIERIRVTDPSDPNAMQVIADALDCIVNKMIDKDSKCEAW